MHPTPAASPALPRRWWLAPLVLVAIFYVATLPLILSGRVIGRAGDDQINYHEPTIRQFARELPPPLPGPDLRNYLSATTPGYHLLLAMAARLGLDSKWALQLLASVFTAGLLALLGASCARRVGPGWGLVLCLPALCSMYVFMPGVWLLPDGAGWLGVLALLVLALDGRPGLRMLVIGGAVLAGLVLMRQVHVWAACLVWSAAWLDARAGRCDRLGAALTPAPARLRALGLAILATLPAFLIVLAFVRLWGGLTPPRFQEQYHGLNAAAPAFVLALLGGFGPFYLVPLLFRGGTDIAGAVPARQLALALVAGLAVAAIPETSTSLAEGRSSGIWNIAAKLPLIAGHCSPLMVVMSGVGAVVLVVWCRLLAPRDRWIVLACLAGFTAAEAASFLLFQRYAEPMVLMLLAVMASRVTAPRAEGAKPPTRRVAAALPVVLAALLASVTAWTLYSSGEPDVSDDLPGKRPVAPAAP
jgi:hypothetical protein